MCSDNQFTVDVAVTVLVDKMDDRLLCVIACIFVTLGGCRQCTVGLPCGASDEVNEASSEESSHNGDPTEWRHRAGEGGLGAGTHGEVCSSQRRFHQGRDDRCDWSDEGQRVQR